jgi:hypothetical protein
MRVTRPFLLCLAAAWLCLPAVARADAEQPAVLGAGDVRIVAAGGALMVDRGWTWGLEASLRAGLGARLEIAAPLALGVMLIGDDEGSGIVLGAGVVDLWVTPAGEVLLNPAVVVAGRARVSAEASLRAAFDLTGVEHWNFAGQHPAWVRGAVALLIDFGPWVSLAGGLSHQRLSIGEGAPRGTRRTGWVGDARFSAGAVRTEPFGELPTLAVHATCWLDVIALVRVDIDSDHGTTDLRLLAGFGLKL